MPSTLPRPAPDPISKEGIFASLLSLPEDCNPSALRCALLVLLMEMEDDIKLSRFPRHYIEEARRLLEDNDSLLEDPSCPISPTEIIRQARNLMRLFLDREKPIAFGFSPLIE